MSSCRCATDEVRSSCSTVWFSPYLEDCATEDKQSDIETEFLIFQNVREQNSRQVLVGDDTSEDISGG